MPADVYHWIKSCHQCNQRKIPKNKSGGKLQSIKVSQPWEMIGIDIIGPLPITNNGNRYIAVICDYFTKWPEAFAIPNQTTIQIAKILVEEVICRHGAPKQLLSDRGKAFLSELSQEIYQILKTKKVNTSPYHPQTDGLVEKFNHTLEIMISHFVDRNQKDWDIYLPYLLFAYRTSPHKSTNETPFKLIYGRDAHLPMDLNLTEAQFTEENIDSYALDLANRFTEAYEIIRQNIQQSQKDQQKYYNKKRQDISFNIGDLVWYLVPPIGKKNLTPKFMPKSKGPFKILGKTSPVNYIILDMTSEGIKRKMKKRKRIVHVSTLRPYTLRNSLNDTNKENSFQSKIIEEENISLSDLFKENEIEKTESELSITSENKEQQNQETPDDDEEEPNEIRLHSRRARGIGNSSPTDKLKILSEILKIKRDTFRNKTGYSLLQMKRELRRELGRGTPHLQSSSLIKKLESDIGSIGTREAMIKLLDKLYLDFNTTFLLEIQLQSRSVLNEEGRNVTNNNQ